MATKEKTVPTAKIGVVLGHERMNKGKSKVLAVKDYVTIDNLWLDPAKAEALLVRFEQDVSQLHRDLHEAVKKCQAAAAARAAAAKAPKPAMAPFATAPPAFDANALALFRQFMAMMQAQTVDTPAKAEADAPVAETRRERETAKERAERLKSITK
jgi:hypothetical protein